MKRGEKNRFKVALLIETPPQIQNNYSPSYNLFSKCRKKERKVRENTWIHVSNLHLPSNDTVGRIG